MSSPWSIGAGAIRNLVWDSLHGYVTPTRPADVDLAYFAPSDLSSIRDSEIQRSLTAQCPEIPWEVTNQAAVHLWFESTFGHPVLPFRSLAQAIASSGLLRRSRGHLCKQSQPKLWR
nr:nucleotidyltransferase family protein [Burkholderia ubonensis]